MCVNMAHCRLVDFALILLTHCQAVTYASAGEAAAAWHAAGSNGEVAGDGSSAEILTDNPNIKL